jgi:hypothetical protein
MAIAPFPTQPELTAIAIRYTNQEYIADRVSPRFPVGAAEFKWMKFDLAEGFTIPDTRIGRRSVPQEVEFSATEQTSSVEDYGLDDLVPNADVERAPPNYDPIARAVQGVTDLVMLDREVRVANVTFGAATYATANKVTLSGTSQWSDYTNSDPIPAILNAFDGMVMRPNVGVLGQAVWTRVRQHPKVIKAVYGPNLDGGLVTPQQLAAVLELDEIIIGRAWRNTAKRGQTTTMGRVWGKHAAFIRRNPSPAGPSAMPTFTWTAQFGTRVAGQMNEPKIGLRGSQRVRSGESVKEVVSANDLGYLFTDAVA